MTSTIKADVVTAQTTNGNVSVQGNGTGKVRLGDGNLIFPDADAAAGQILTTDGSANLAFAATPGTSGNVLTSNGSAWTSAAAAGGQWSLKASGTSSNVAELEITGLTKRTFIFVRNATMASTASLELAVSEDEGSTYPNYNWVDTYQYTGGTSFTTTTGTGHPSLTSALTVQSDARNSVNSWIELPNPANATRIQTIVHDSVFGRVVTSGDWYRSWGVAKQSSSTQGAIDNVRLKASTGNLSIEYYFVWEQGE